jgi:hypothetical protein
METKTIKISGLWILVVVAVAIALSVTWCKRNHKDPLPYIQNIDSLKKQAYDKDAQIYALNNNLKALQKEITSWQYKDAALGKSIASRDIMIKLLKGRVLAADSLKNMTRDSAINFIIGEYGVVRDTLYLMGGDVPWQIAEDITKSELLDSILPEMDKQIGELKSLNTLKGLVITNLTSQVVNRDSVVRVQLGQLSVKNDLIASQQHKIRQLKIQRIVIAGGGIVLLLIAL